MSIAETINIEGGYKVEIHYDEDATNPMKDDESGPTLVLHDKAEKHFGWTTDDDWHRKLNCALEDILDRGHTKDLHGERGALAVLNRWMRAYHGIRVVLPVGAGQHSGTWAYVGDHEHFSDSGGWDSGWVGWLFVTPEQAQLWYDGNPTEEQLIDGLRGHFKEFSSWVEGSTYGYVVKDPQGEEIDSCWGFYGSETYDEVIETESIVGQRPVVGWKVRGPFGGISTITKVEDDEYSKDLWWITFDGGGIIADVRRGGSITLIHSGHMREEFMDAIDRDRKARDEDEAEIREMQLAEVGA